MPSTKLAKPDHDDDDDDFIMMIVMFV